ncbi:hypothetical protein K470DRAFT_254709 [Piedraia hortae CBS 480.64]|uniref:Homoserine dehydrogenase n=1 Tax=Piedraia hortae CBS 480.64 TaxID=1314780 RepID=A0A6A7C9Z5_9PEZI|nr:hypothetical protein K470DRAFT_254709 [Piedraia hortae CBS 480.64]
MTPTPIFVASIGTGGVGKAFLAQLAQLHTRLSRQTPAFDIRLILLRRSSSQVLTKDYSNLGFDIQLQSGASQVTEWPEVVKFLSSAPGKVVLVDNTASAEVGEWYPEFLKKGINVVTPNKKAFSSSQELWDKIQAASPGKVLHESTVGAGLPVLTTLNDLIDTGDKVKTIEGVFSGTMSFLFNSYMPLGGSAEGGFGGEVFRAQKLGYTEPDPREDLNGLDVARKLTILARICGLKVASSQAFPVESLIPAELEQVSSEDFVKRLPEFDSVMEKRKKAAESEGKVLRYIGKINVSKSQLEVGVKAVEKSHPMAALKGSDNIICFTTERYGELPLVIQGAGAGNDVTAMGVLADLLRIARMG